MLKVMCSCSPEEHNVLSRYTTSEWSKSLVGWLFMEVIISPTLMSSLLAIEDFLIALIKMGCSPNGLSLPPVVRNPTSSRVAFSLTSRFSQKLL